MTFCFPLHRSFRDFLRMIAIVACLLLASASGSFAQWWTIAWSNDVDFKLSDGITDVSYSEVAHTITDGQPWEKISQNLNSKRLEITIKAGRKGSKPVADWFTDRLYNHEYGAIADKTLRNNLPGLLNFATEGVLTIEGNQYHIVLGQGHSDPYNNWWLGGPDLTGFCARGMMATTDGKYFITVEDQNTFKITRATVNRPAWMSGVNGGALLSEISIPATHDSATYHATGVSNVWTVTQSFSILAQLNMGIRYLDIRLRYRDGELKTYHGPVDLDLPFSLVLKQAIDFLDANPTETVIMAIKKEEDGGDSLADAFQDLLEEEDPHFNRFWLEDSMPALDEVRGRIVFIDREECIEDGIQIAEWPKNKTFETNGAVDFYIQDHYSFAVTNLDEKISDVEDQMKRAIAGPADTWYVNFLSAAGWTRTPKGVAETVNPEVLKDLRALAPGRVGTMVMDFAGEISTPRIINMIVERNPGVVRAVQPTATTPLRGRLLKASSSKR